MANALHFVMRQERMMQRIHDYLKPQGRFIIVEYDRPLPWTPFPVTFPRFEALATKAGFQHIQQIGTRTSPSNGVTMYAAVASLIHL